MEAMCLTSPAEMMAMDSGKRVRKATKTKPQTSRLPLAPLVQGVPRGSAEHHTARKTACHLPQADYIYDRDDPSRKKGLFEGIAAGGHRQGYCASLPSGEKQHKMLMAR